MDREAMPEDSIPEREDLSKKPLVEAIFELNWALQPGQGSDVDPGFKILFGRFYDQVRGEYQDLENLPQAQLPEELTGRLVRHRFRSAKDKWPLIQIGPGVLSVNDTDGYTWDDFRPRLNKAVRALHASYPSEIQPLTITQVLLRYIDAIPYDGKTPVLSFLKESLHTTIEMDQRLFEDSQSANSPFGLNLSLLFRLPELPGVVSVTFALGLREEKPSIIWDTQILAKGDDIPKTLDEYDTWIGKAHTISGKWFRTLSRGKLYDSFKGDKE